MPVKIDNVRIFDGEQVLDQRSVTFDDGLITAVGEDSTEGASVVDGSGSTLLPGLIDAHVHTDLDLLRLALTFGVTTELEMLGHWTAEQRREIAHRDDLADLRTAERGVTDPDGHPHALHREIAKRKGAKNEALEHLSGSPARRRPSPSSQSRSKPALITSRS